MRAFPLEQLRKSDDAAMHAPGTVHVLLCDSLFSRADVRAYIRDHSIEHRVRLYDLFSEPNDVEPGDEVAVLTHDAMAKEEERRGIVLLDRWEEMESEAAGAHGQILHRVDSLARRFHSITLNVLKDIPSLVTHWVPRGTRVVDRERLRLFQEPRFDELIRLANEILMERGDLKRREEGEVERIVANTWLLGIPERNTAVAGGALTERRRDGSITHLEALFTLYKKHLFGQRFLRLVQREKVSQLLFAIAKKRKGIIDFYEESGFRDAGRLNDLREEKPYLKELTGYKKKRDRRGRRVFLFQRKQSALDGAIPTQ